MKRVCVFCGSSPRADERYFQVARQMGAVMAHRGLELVYGGARIGLMGAVADAVLENGGEVTGVLPEALMAREVAHTGLTQLYIVDSMHQRKALMAELADGFIALPGGIGTLEEFCEILTWSQLGLHKKPCGLLNSFGYYRHLIALFDQMVAERFFQPEYRSMVLIDEDPLMLLAGMQIYRPPTVEQWITEEEI